MRWTKLKQKIEQNFTDSLRKRVAIHSAAYGACTCGHVWITLDGEVIANFCTMAFHNRYKYGDKDNDRGVSTKKAKAYKDQFVEYGEISRQDAYESCWDFVHNLSFDEALQSNDPLVQTLAVMDKRLGKRRYLQIEKATLHPLARKLFEVRQESERARREL